MGKVKLKFGGGNGGHNGLSNIDEMIWNNYNRIRIGINHPGSKNLVSSYVLNKFTKEELSLIEKKLDKVKQTNLQDNKYHQKPAVNYSIAINISIELITGIGLGVFLGLLVFKMDFVVVMTMIGVISLIGIVVNNAIVLIDFIE